MNPEGVGHHAGKPLSGGGLSGASSHPKRARTPTPPSASTARRLKAQKREDTAPELAVRRELFARGLRYRLHQTILPGSRTRADIVFRAARVAVDVRGCFWHGCPEHGTTPKSNRDWWVEKLGQNRRRDESTEEALRAAGWQVVVIWEHEDVMEAADRIEDLVRRQTD